MNGRLLGTAAVTALALLGWWAAHLVGGGVEAGEMRSLSRYRVESLPERLPERWQQQLTAALAAAPEVELLEPDSLLVAERVLKGLAWIAPESVRARLRLPDGIELEFQPRVLGVAVLQQGRLMPVSLDGTVLPAGLSTDHLSFLARIPAEGQDTLPEPGGRVADPLIQEALRAVYEFDAVRQLLGGDLIGIERQPGYPRNAAGVPPAMAFVTRGGCRLHWGRSDESRDPRGVPAELKIQRLAVVLRAYPALQGIAHVLLDAPRVRLLDPSGAELRLPEVLR